MRVFLALALALAAACAASGAAVSVSRAPPVFLPHDAMKAVLAAPASSAERAWALGGLMEAGRPGSARLVTPESADRVVAAYARALTEPSPRRRGNSMVAASGGVTILGAYYIEVRVGGQPFNLLLDTGSSNTAVASTLCGSTCGAGKQYDPEASAAVPFAGHGCKQCLPTGETSPCPFGEPINATFAGRPESCGAVVSYGGGSSFLAGVLTRDTVEVGAGLAVNGTVIAISREIPDAAFSTPPLSGIVGFAHELNAIVPSWVPTPFGLAVKAGQVGDVIGLCLNASGGGALDLGAANPSRFTGPVRWAQGGQLRWYEVDMLDIAVGSASVGLPPAVYGFNNDQIGAFVDSGTSALLLAPAAMSALQAAFQSKHSSLPGVVASSDGPGIFGGQCLTDAQMGLSLHLFPTLTVRLAGAGGGDDVLLEVGPESYFFHSDNSYCLAVSGVPGVGAVLGDVLLTNYYTIHDRVNNRVGFADVTSCAQ